ncbi:hypothetical protein MHYP_G00041680 [Metynnis hypsauchen]
MPAMGTFKHILLLFAGLITAANGEFPKCLSLSAVLLLFWRQRSRPGRAADFFVRQQDGKPPYLISEGFVVEQTEERTCFSAALTNLGDAPDSVNEGVGCVGSELFRVVDLKDQSLSVASGLFDAL